MDEWIYGPVQGNQTIMKERSTSYKAQVGALPVRGLAGHFEVLLVTSRETKRWIIPKGWPMKGKADHDAAAQEAFEEAGALGRIRKHPVGAYAYEKRSVPKSELVRVMVYLLHVSKEAKRWPEQAERIREWMSVKRAAELVGEGGLSKIISRLNELPDV